MFIIKSLLYTLGQPSLSSSFCREQVNRLKRFGSGWLRLWDPIDSFFVQLFSLARARTIHLLFSPFYSSVLEPNLNLCFSQIKRGGEVMSLRSHHVLLSIKFFLQSLELFGCENCANSLWFSLLEIPGFVFFMMNNW